MKAIITNASEVRIDGQQSVSFDILDKDSVVASSTLDGDVDSLKDQIKQMLNDYDAKLRSIKRLKVGDVVNQ
jgi:hypothetical protein